VRVAKSVPGIEIKRDDVVLAASSIGSKLPVDPGKHVVVISAPGYDHVQLEVTIGVAGDSQTLDVPELRPAAGAPPAGTETSPAPGPTAAPAPSATAPPDADRSASGGNNTLAWIIGGTGVVFAGVGATFGVLALSAYDDAKKACPTYQNCSHEAVETRSRAETRANIANVGVGLGIVGIGVATVMLLTSGSSEPEHRPPTARRAVLVPRVGTHDAGLTFMGDF
jgi:hypothetical protein